MKKKKKGSESEEEEDESNGIEKALPSDEEEAIEKATRHTPLIPETRDDVKEMSGGRLGEEDQSKAQLPPAAIEPPEEPHRE